MLSSEVNEIPSRLNDPLRINYESQIPFLSATSSKFHISVEMDDSRPLINSMQRFQFLW